MFYDREEELALLEDLKKRSEKRSLMLVITGRRRVGKTAIVREFLRNNPGAYLFVEVKDEKMILKDVEKSLEVVLGMRPSIDSWTDLFDILREKNLTLIMDEFQNFSSVNSGIFSTFQGIWDSLEGDAGVFLILVGSYMGMMKKIFTDAKEPLFGRAERIVEIKPFDFIHASEFMGLMGVRDTEKHVIMYSVLGGIPKYLLYLEDTTDKDFLWELFYSPMAPLRDEGRNLLVMEFGKEHRGYFSILEAVARGKCTQKEISDYTGMPKDTVGKYLFELTGRYGILKKIEPIPTTRRNAGRYVISDNFHTFWFRFVYSLESLIEIDPERAVKLTEKNLPSYVGRIFEDIVRELIVKKKVFEADSIGSWWSRRGDEIDIVALNEKKKEILFGEVKWRNRPVDCDVLDALMEKKELVQWHNDDRKEKFFIVSKSGFTEKCLERMEGEGVIHWDLEDVEGIVKRV